MTDYYSQECSGTDANIITTCTCRLKINNVKTIKKDCRKKKLAMLKEKKIQNLTETEQKCDHYHSKGLHIHLLF